MKVTVFTSNQPRHIFLINELSKVSDYVFAVQECSTIFPGESTGNNTESQSMTRYFEMMRLAEKKEFGSCSFSSDNVRTLSLNKGDLNNCMMEELGQALQSDYYVVFGSSYIKGWLIDFLIEHRAVNIHMGVSPYYRGSACNFWALYDGNPDLVGGSIILLSKGLDSGKLLYHALPKADRIDGFLLGMRAVKASVLSVANKIADSTIYNYEPLEQDKFLEIRYSRSLEFDNRIAENYLENMPDEDDIYTKILGRNESMFYNPFYM